MKNLLVVTSDNILNSNLTTIVKKANIHISVTDKLDEAIEHLQSYQPHCIALDTALPNMDSLIALAEIRQRVDVPLLLLTNTDGTALILRSLNLRDISFLPRTARPHAIIAHVEKIMHGVLPAYPLYNDGRLRIDLEHGIATLNEQPLRLTNIEMKILTYLLSYRNKTVPYSEIISHVWGSDHQYQTHYVQTYINRLRAKLEQDPKWPRYLQNERGVGYRFRAAIG